MGLWYNAATVVDDRRPAYHSLWPGGEDSVNANWTKNGFVYLLILVAVVALFFSLFPQTSQVETQEISTIAEWIQQGKVASVSIVGEEVRVRLNALARLAPGEPFVASGQRRLALAWVARAQASAIGWPRCKISGLNNLAMFRTNNRRPCNL